MRTLVAALAVVAIAVVLVPGGGGGVLGMTLGGAAVLSLSAGIAVWVRRTMSHL